MQMNCRIFTARGKNYYTCGKTLLHLGETLHLWEDIITLVVDYYQFSDYYTCGSNMAQQASVKPQGLYGLK